MTESYSDLQVDPDVRYSRPLAPTTSSTQVPRHVHAHSDKIVVDNVRPSREPNEPRRRRRTCRLTTKACWIVAIIVIVVVVAAAVGGGIGGSRASKKNSSSSSSSSSSTISSPSTASASTSSTAPVSSITTGSTTTTLSISTSTAIGPSQTLLVDCPSSNDTLYTPPSTSQTFRKVCGRTFIGNGGGINVVNQPTALLDECIGLCAAYNVLNATQIASGNSPVCNALCWRATVKNDDFPGQCFGFTTTNSSGSFVFNDDSRCDGAALINQAFV